MNFCVLVGTFGLENFNIVDAGVACESESAQSAASVKVPCFSFSLIVLH